MKKWTQEKGYKQIPLDIHDNEQAKKQLRIMGGGRK